jgi:hypothetical protein
MNELAEKISAGEEVSPDEMEKLFKETSELMKDMNVPSQVSKQVLEKLEQASLANMLGEKEKASELLNETAKMMQEIDKQYSEPSPLAEKFNKMISQLITMYRVQETNSKYLDNLPAQKNIASALEKIIKNQNDIKKVGKEFATEFRDIFEPILGAPHLFSFADRGATHAQTAHGELSKNIVSAKNNMSAALQNWKTLLQLLYRLQQQQQQQQSMSGQKKLTIGKNGELKYSEQGIVPGEDEEDSRQAKRNDNDLKLDLPEDFQKARNVENFLKNELKLIENPDRRELFQKYIYDLLE